MDSLNLHLESVSEPLLNLLNRLMTDPVLEAFFLVGGTALAMEYGHRISVDLDLFTLETFDPASLAAHLKETVCLTEAETAPHTVRGVVGNIKIDLIRHHYPEIAPVEAHGGIRLASSPDLAAMKLNAIANRGSKKDFWDLHRLLEEYALEELIAFAGQKYAGDSIWNLRRSLLYFEDANTEPSPRDLRGLTWEQVKADLIQKIPFK